MRASDAHKPAQSIAVYRARDLRVVNGANLGDGISFADELVLDDIYGLSPVARQSRLSIIANDTPPHVIAGDSELGQPGASLYLDCCVTFMSGDGAITEVIVLIETDDDGNVADAYVLPLAGLDRDHDYALVGVDRDTAQRKFAQVACVSFTRGTLITMASGEQRPIETLSVGDRVLTRDDGPQEIRWIGHTTTRAVGDFAPIRIKAGTLHNANDLIVSPDHRLFIYQRTDRLGAGRAELLVKARHLVNGDTVTRVNGGFVDYFQMLFDQHQIIFAEGIAAESMLADTRTRAALPKEALRKLTEGLDHRDDHGVFEVQESLLKRPDAADLLRKSTGG